MTLDEFMRNHGLTNTAMAERCGRHPSRVSRWRTGRGVPDPDAIQRIFKATDGAVTANDWFGQAAADGAPAPGAA